MNGNDHERGTARRPGGALLALGLAALVLSPVFFSPGCGGGRKGGAISLARQAPQDSFALYYPVPSATAARVAPYSVNADLTNVVGASVAPADQEARRALAVHGFVAVPGTRGRLDLAYRDISAPKFVTLDAALFALHSLGSRILYRLERDVLAADLGELLRAMLDGMRGIYEDTEGAVREAASADLAFLGVASRLLGQEAELPREAAELAEKELALISGMGGEATSPLTGTRVDYGRPALGSRLPGQRLLGGGGERTQPLPHDAAGIRGLRNELSVGGPRG